MKPTDEYEKAKKAAFWNIDTNEVGFYGRGSRWFSFCKVDFIQDIIDGCQYELKNCTTRDELIDFIKKGDFGSFEGKLNDVQWIYDNYVKYIGITNESWTEEVHLRLGEFLSDYVIDEKIEEEIVSEISEHFEETEGFDYLGGKKIKFLSVSKEGVNFLICEVDENLLSKNNFVGQFLNTKFKSEKIKWCDSYKGKSNPIENFIENRKTFLGENVSNWKTTTVDTITF